MIKYTTSPFDFDRTDFVERLIANSTLPIHVNWARDRERKKKGGGGSMHPECVSLHSCLHETKEKSERVHTRTV